MATHLRMKDPDTAVGKLVRLWIWADANSVDGQALAITFAFIDRLTACKGFAAAMEKVGWLVTGSDGLLTFPGFHRHNGDSAKRRAAETRKKHLQRGAARDKCPGDDGTNVPAKTGKRPGPELEGDLGERERGRGAPGNPSFPPPPSDGDHAGLIVSLRPEWQAAPALSDEEASALAKNRSAIAAIEPATWDIMRRFMAHRFPEGDARWQPTKRLVAIRTLGDIAAQAVAWHHGNGGSKPAAVKQWPAAFEAWASDRYPTTPPRVLWLSPSIRADFEKHQTGEAA